MRTLISSLETAIVKLLVDVLITLSVLKNNVPFLLINGASLF